MKHAHARRRIRVLPIQMKIGEAANDPDDERDDRDHDKPADMPSAGTCDENGGKPVPDQSSDRRKKTCGTGRTKAAIAEIAANAAPMGPYCFSFSMSLTDPE